MVGTDCGSVIEVNDGQSDKAPVPMLVADGGNVTEANFVQQ